MEPNAIQYPSMNTAAYAHNPAYAQRQVAYAANPEASIMATQPTVTTAPKPVDKAHNGKFDWGRVISSPMNALVNMGKAIVNDPLGTAGKVALAAGVMLAAGAGIAAMGLAAGAVAGAAAIGSVLLAGSAIYYGAKILLNGAGAATAALSGDVDLAEERAVNAGEAIGELALTAAFSKAVVGKNASKAATFEVAEDAGKLAKSWNWLKNVFYKDAKVNMTKSAEEAGAALAAKHPGKAATILENHPKTAQALNITEEKIAAGNNLKTAQVKFDELKTQVDAGTLKPTGKKFATADKELQIAKKEAQDTGILKEESKSLYETKKEQLTKEIEKNPAKAEKIEKKLGKLSEENPEVLRKKAASLRAEALEESTGTFKSVAKNHEARGLEKKAAFLEKEPPTLLTYAWDPTKTGLRKLENVATATAPIIIYNSASDDYDTALTETTQAVDANNPALNGTIMPGTMPMQGGHGNIYEDPLFIKLAQIDPRYAQMYMGTQIAA